MFRTGANNQTVVATRTFQLTNTRTKAGLKSTFKALENLIRFKDSDGENSTANRRCADMDNAIPALMGVPRAIIEHVIFCHQEDSNWPLGERILLKKRFDEIFGSSRYTKALETIEKQRKEILKEAKEKGHVLALVGKDRDTALELRRERGRHSETLETLSDRVNELDRQISRKESELDRIQALEAEFRDKLIRLENLNREIAKVKLICGNSAAPANINARLAELEAECSDMERRKQQISQTITNEKAMFETLVKERADLTARLRSVRNSQLESSNLQDLVRLKVSELQQAVDSARGSTFLPETFVFNTDQPGLSIRLMEQVLQEQTSVNECNLHTLSAQLKHSAESVCVLEKELSEKERRYMQLVSEANLTESKLRSARDEARSLDEKISALEPLNESTVEQLDKDLKRIGSEKRTLSVSLDDIKADLQDLISDSVSSVTLMHSSPEDLLSHLESKRSGLVEKIESSLKASSPNSDKGETFIQSSSEIDQVTEELVGARQTLALLTSMKTKSLAESKCQVCRQRLSSVSEFEAAIDRLTRKLPDIIAANEARRQTLSQSAISALEEVRKTLIPELVDTERKISRIQALMEAISLLGNDGVDTLERERRLRELEEEENKLGDRKNFAVMTLAQHKALVERRMALDVAIDEFQSELPTNVESTKIEVEEIRARLGNAKEENRAVSERMQKESVRMDSHINSLRNSFQVIFQIASQVDSLRSRMVQENQVPGAVNDLVLMEQRETEISQQLTRVMSSMSACEDERTGIDSQLNLKKAEVESLKVHAQLRALEAELKKLTTSSGNDEFQKTTDTVRLTNEIKKLRDESSRLMGESAQIQNQVSEIERKLNSATLSDVDEKHRQAFCCFENHNILAKDVQRYHQALDRALMNYHSQKMSQINEVIRDLWGRIYKGTDIDYIAIRSDTDAGDEENTPGTAKRSYNYRVVMVKGDVELEMRGRCSAGQKVVACLIIRLALAESFCLSCGILALDEPTTNLDRGNIGGLAEALADLIAARREQRNFQLIIITHDESFVNMLGNLRACDHFHRVTKNEFGFSTISRSNIHEIHTRAR